MSLALSIPVVIFSHMFAYILGYSMPELLVDPQGTDHAEDRGGG